MQEIANFVKSQQNALSSGGKYNDNDKIEKKLLQFVGFRVIKEFCLNLSREKQFQ